MAFAIKLRSSRHLLTVSPPSTIEPPQGSFQAPSATRAGDGLDVHALQAQLERQGDQWSARYGGHRLFSHFQPIYSLAHRRAVGHEALLRAQDAHGQWVPPARLLGAHLSLDELLHVDRLCRLVHAHNFAAQRAPDHWLFLNVHPQVFMSGPMHGTPHYMRHLAEHLNLMPEQLVLEVTEDAIGSDASFDAAVLLAREMGCLLALDDFGAGHSNFDRVWRIRPEIVKLDRSVVVRAASETRVARVVMQMVSLLHECGALVLLEGIETEREAYLALEAGADFVQGFYFGRPQPMLASAEPQAPTIDAVWRHFDSEHDASDRAYRERIGPYINAIGYAASLISAGRDAALACTDFLALPGAELCYLLDERGMQVGRNMVSPLFEVMRSPQFSPLADARHARWARRSYFRRALESFGRVQVTRPYLTVNGAHLCVTVSVSLRLNGELIVLGGDIAWGSE